MTKRGFLFTVTLPNLVLIALLLLLLDRLALPAHVIGLTTTILDGFLVGNGFRNHIATFEWTAKAGRQVGHTVA
jgi:hypothetical protein